MFLCLQRGTEKYPGPGGDRRDEKGKYSVAWYKQEDETIKGQYPTEDEVKAIGVVLW